MKSKWVKGLFLLLILCAASLFIFRKPAKEVVYQQELGQLCWPTQFSSENDQLIISDYKNDRILYKNASQDWQRSPISLKGAHSIRYIKGWGYLIDDSEGDRLIKVKSLSDPQPQYLDNIAGKGLQRPHDILDGGDGFAYIVDAHHLFRIRDFSGQGEILNFGNHPMGYVRALALLDGKVHVISASRGEIIRVDDFSKGQLTVFSTVAHKADADAGAYGKTGPILNGVTQLKGYYYASSYFTPSYAPGYDTDTHRLIRWRTWQDYQQGKVEDVSDALPRGQVPYFLSHDSQRLMMTSYNHEKPCQGDIAFYLSL